jgi:hypothetical protein
MVVFRRFPVNKITRRQIAAVKYIIFKSKDAGPLAKRVLAFLLDRSDLLKREVYITLREGKGYEEFEVQEAAVGVHDLISSNGQTFLNQVMDVSGTRFHFSFHVGTFNGGKTGPLAYTFWCAKGYYLRGAKLVRVSRVRLDTINLEKSGLFPKLEPK